MRRYACLHCEFSGTVERVQKLKEQQILSNSTSVSLLSPQSAFVLICIQQVSHDSNSAWCGSLIQADNIVLR